MAKNISILIFSDDNVYITNLSSALRRFDYKIDVCNIPKDALEAMKKRTPYMIISDDMFKKELNNEFILEIRKISNIPLVVLTESNNLDYKLMCFSIGVDEIINKEWDCREAAARVNAVLKRCANSDYEGINEILHKDLYVNISSYDIMVCGKKFKLPPKETELLYFLASNPGQVFTREQLLYRVWGYDYFGDSRTVDVHIKKLRKRFAGLTKAWSLDTVWGVGYKFTVS